MVKQVVEQLKLATHALVLLLFELTEVIENREGSEQCDDGNTKSSDGCFSIWSIESGYSWIGNSSSWTLVWGDGLVNGSEEWDDKDILNDDGWNSKCIVEENYSWSEQSSSCSISIQIDYLSTIIRTWIQDYLG